MNFTTDYTFYKSFKRQIKIYALTAVQCRPEFLTELRSRFLYLQQTNYVLHFLTLRTF